MFVPKDDRLRHEILGLLLDKFERTPSKTDYDTAIRIDDLAARFKVSPDKIRQAASVLLRDDVIRQVNYRDGVGICAWKDAYPAYHEKKYLRQGKEVARKDIAFYLSLTAVVSLALSVINTVNSCTKAQGSRQEIEHLQQQIDALKNKPSIPAQPVVRPALPYDSNTLKR